MTIAYFPQQDCRRLFAMMVILGNRKTKVETAAMRSGSKAAPDDDHQKQTGELK